MVALPPPAPSVLPVVRLHVGEASRVEGAILVRADNPLLLRAYQQEGAFAFIGKKTGATTVHFRSDEGDPLDVRFEVIAGEPTPRALAVGETFVVPMKGVKDYSLGLSGIVDGTLTSDGSQLLVTGRRAGATTVLLIDANGSQRSHELVIIGGERRS